MVQEVLARISAGYTKSPEILASVYRDLVSRVADGFSRLQSDLIGLMTIRLSASLSADLQWAEKYKKARIPCECTLAVYFRLQRFK